MPNATEISFAPGLAPMPEAPVAAPRTVLIVDDEEPIREVLARIVIGEGHTVMTASDGQEALEVLSRHPDVDLLFLDVMMPRLDGLAALAQLRQTQGHSLPTVIISGKASGENILNGYNAGVDYYVTKPFRPETVRNILHYLMEDLDEQELCDLELLL